MSRLKSMSIKVPSSLSTKVARLAKRHGTTQSEIVREALESYSGNEKVSFSDVAAEFCGKAEGPGDLSTNRRYLADFGA